MLLESLPAWIRVHHQIPFAAQAAAVDVNESTVRRWVYGIARARPSVHSAYLLWVCTQVFAPLNLSTGEPLASIPPRWRVFWSASSVSYCVLVVCRGRLIRCERGSWPREERLEALRERLIDRVGQWGRAALGASSDEI